MITRQLFGLAEIAEAVDADPATVRVWYHRKKLPAPTEKLATGPVWLRADIEPWITTVIEHGGRPPELPRGRPRKSEDTCKPTKS